MEKPMQRRHCTRCMLFPCWCSQTSRKGSRPRTFYTHSSGSSCTFCHSTHSQCSLTRESRCRECTYYLNLTQTLHSRKSIVIQFQIWMTNPQPRTSCLSLTRESPAHCCLICKPSGCVRSTGNSMSHSSCSSRTSQSSYSSRINPQKVLCEN